MARTMLAIAALFLLGATFSCSSRQQPAAKQKSATPTDQIAITPPEQKMTATGAPPLDTNRTRDHLSPANPTQYNPKNTPENFAPHAQNRYHGPSAYISNENAVLYNEPTQQSAKKGNLKLYETVYILETIMKDDQGRPTQVPTWYKVQCENKRTGWILGSWATVN